MERNFRAVNGKAGRMRSRVAALVAAAAICGGAARAQGGNSSGPGTVFGQVVDAQGGAIEGAEAILRTGQQMPLGVRVTDKGGRFEFERVPRGTYVLVVRAKRFGEQRLAITQPADGAAPLRVQLDVAGLRSEVTVTAYTGAVETADLVAQGVNIIGAEKIRERTLAVMGQVAQEEPGVQLLRTSPTIAGIVVRGMGGNKVNLYVDGVRYTTSATRGGISTFLNLIEPATLDTVEVLRGPAGAQYGSDAIGGTVQFLTSTPAFSADKTVLRGNYGTVFNSADTSHGTHLNLSAAGRRLAVQGTLAVRRASRLRTGQGIDSHSALTRFLGLPSMILEGDRRGDTAFTQYGGLLKLGWTPAAGSNFSVNYRRSQQDGGKRYDQLLGGRRKPGGGFAQPDAGLVFRAFRQGPDGLARFADRDLLV